MKDDGFEGTGNHNDIWEYEVTRTENGSEWAPTDDKNKYNLCTILFDGDVAIEFDLKLTLVSNFFDIVDSNGNRVAQGSTSEIGGQNNVWASILIVCQNGTITEYNQDNGQYSVRATSVSYNKFRFLRYSSQMGRVLTFKNFKIYPI